MTLGVEVLKAKGQKVRGWLKNEKLYEDKFLPLKLDSTIVFPVRRAPDSKELCKLGARVKHFQFRENKRTRSFRRELQKILPKSLYEEAARAYEQVGDIGIITVFPDMVPFEKQIAKALLETNKGIRLVVKKQSKYQGKQRLQDYQKLAGSGPLITTHMENGVKIKLDLSKVYFSARTANERKRVAALVRPGENVLVMFSGAAPFPLVIACNSKASNIVGIELNPVAHKYAQANVELNSVSNVELIQGDAKQVAKLNQRFERIIMPAPTIADYFLKYALKVAAKSCIIHMYLFSRPEKLDYVKHKIKDECALANFFVKSIEVVEQMHISSQVKKFCFDIKVKGRA